MSVARAYAKALYEICTEKGAAAGATGIEDQLRNFATAAGSSREARTAFFGPIVTSKEKIALIDGIASKMGLSEPTKRFLGLLARKNRLRILSKIIEAFRAIRIEADGGIIGTVVAADMLNNIYFNRQFPDVNLLRKKLGPSPGLASCPRSLV